MPGCERWPGSLTSTKMGGWSPPPLEVYGSLAECDNVKPSAGAGCWVLGVGGGRCIGLATVSHSIAGVRAPRDC
jgi:hypothetical protein